MNTQFNSEQGVSAETEAHTSCCAQNTWPGQVIGTSTPAQASIAILGSRSSALPYVPISSVAWASAKTLSTAPTEMCVAQNTMHVEAACCLDRVGLAAWTTEECITHGRQIIICTVPGSLDGILVLLAGHTLVTGY